MTYSRFPHARVALLIGCLAAFGLGCDNSVDRDVPDPEATPPGWSLVWSDEFDGAELDTTKWEIQLGDGCDLGICGWGNAEFQNYTAENLAVDGGTLTITARQDIVAADTVIADGDTTTVEADTSYTSSRIRTLGRGDWTYGRFEVRAKLPTGQGLWPAIWLLFSEPTYGQWAASGEIDIMEAIGSEPGEVFGTLHYGGESPNNVFSGEEFQLNYATFDEEFYVFTVEWERVERGVDEDGEPIEGVDIRWYLNNVLYQVQTEEDWFTTGSNDPTAPFNHDFHMILNVAVGGNLPGAPDVSTTFPQTMEVDYVRVYKRTETGE
jgi:beta-glucanase (GH16 family)